MYLGVVTQTLHSSQISFTSVKQVEYYLDKQVVAKLFHGGAESIGAGLTLDFVRQEQSSKTVAEPLILQCVSLPLCFTVLRWCFVFLSPLLRPSGSAVIHKFIALDTVTGSGVGT